MTSLGTGSNFQIQFIHLMGEQDLAFSQREAGGFYWSKWAQTTQINSVFCSIWKHFRGESSVIRLRAGGLSALIKVERVQHNTGAFEILWAILLSILTSQLPRIWSKPPGIHISLIAFLFPRNDGPCLARALAVIGSFFVNLAEYFVHVWDQIFCSDVVRKDA